MFKHLTRWLMILAVLLPCLLVSASATETVRLDLSQGSIALERTVDGVQYTQGGTTVPVGDAVFLIRQSDTSAPTSNTITVSGGEVEMTIAGVNISSDSASPVSVAAGAHLVLNLVGENTMTAGSYAAGLAVPKGAELTVDGPGSLTAEGGDRAAGIGGRYDGGTIIVNGGAVTATGGGSAAGIGGGSSGDGGSITITSGTIIASGSGGGAGIGGGYGGNGGIITISGGTISAEGGYAGAGIGGGSEGNGGAIAISGGTVSAVGGGDGGSAGIGGGYSYSGRGGNGGTIIISGGTVSAIGGYGGVGIGGGSAGAGGRDGTGGTVTIRDAEVYAAGYYNAIGGGFVGNSYGCDSITISNATLDLRYEYVKGSECQERIFDLGLPTEVAALPGSTLTLQTVARGASGLNYQWQCGGTDIAGQTSATLSIPMTVEMDGTYLRCKVTNAYGNAVYTDETTVYALAFAQQPTPVEVNVGDYAALEAKSTCENVSYHWERSYDNGISWNMVPDEIYSTLLVEGGLSENGALYRCVITGTNGDQLASDAVPITVNTDDVTYTVKYYHQLPDGSGYGVAEQVVQVGITNGSVTAPARTFDGFAENTGKGVHSGTVASDGSLVLSRYYDRKNYSITFDMMGGGALPTLTARYGAEVAAPAAPVRYGFDFGGWYVDKELTTPYTFATMPLNGATVYAKWVNLDEGRGIEYQINSILFRDADSYEALDSIPTRDFLVEVNVTNLSSTHMDTVLFVSYDKDGRMLGFHYAFANPAIGQTMTFGTAIDNDDGQVARVKVMILSNLAGATPLAEAAEKEYGY